MEKTEAEERKAALIARHGDWSYDIPLVEGVWTRGNLGVPHTRLKRVVQLVSDLGRKPLKECRVLDLACLEGQYAIEFALHGAQVLGIEGRAGHVEKARFAKEALGLDNVDFAQDDVRNLSVEKYGKFDVVLCLGIFYHLPEPDVFEFAERLHGVLGDLLVLDTKVSLAPDTSVLHAGKRYHGHHYTEHQDTDADETKAGRVWASLDNPRSLVLTRPSLVNLMYNVGFSSIYECFNPPHRGLPEWFDGPNINWHTRPKAHSEIRDRCTFVAIKGEQASLVTSPAADGLREEWEEGDLTYTSELDRHRLERLERLQKNSWLRPFFRAARLLVR